MTLTWIIAIVIAVLIIFGLAFYAGKLLFQLNVQKQKQQAQLEKRQAKVKQRNVKIADSINLISRAMKEKQCEYSEGCLRVWVLMSQYKFSDEIDLEQEYQSIFKMYDVVKEMPTHEARKKYTKKEIFKMDSARWRTEKELEEGILADAEKLATFFPAESKTKHVFTH